MPNSNPLLPPGKASRLARLKTLWAKFEDSFAVNNYDWQLFLRLMGFGVLAIWAILISVFIVFIHDPTFTSLLATFLVGGVLSFLWLPISVASSNNAKKRTGKSKRKKRVRAPKAKDQAALPIEQPTAPIEKPTPPAPMRREEQSAAEQPAPPAKKEIGAAVAPVTPPPVDPSAWLRKQTAAKKASSKP